MNKKSTKTIITPPLPISIIAARQRVQDSMGLGITDAQLYCANLIYKGLRTWQQWEKNDRSMDPAFWELFKIKSNYKDIS